MLVFGRGVSEYILIDYNMTVHVVKSETCSDYRERNVT